MIPIALLLMTIMIVSAVYYTQKTPTLLTAVVCSDVQSRIQLYECESYDHGCINPTLLVSVFYDNGGGTLRYILTPGFYELDFSSVDARNDFRTDHRDFIVTRGSDNRTEKFDCGSFD